MEENHEMEELRQEEYFDRSGCGPILATLLVIVLCWLGIGIYMFTKS